jgi:hypothetical protein
MIKPKFNITEVLLDADQYVNEATTKTQLYLHHSAGWDNVRGMFKDWNITKERVATSFGINDEGEIFQAFDEAFWAYHLYVKSKGNQIPSNLRSHILTGSNAVDLERNSIGVEIANFGPLKYCNGKYFTWVHDYGTKGKGVVLNESKVYDFGESGFRGFRFYERYTDNEVGALSVLITYLCEKHSIPLPINVDNIFEITPSAFLGVPGVYTHCSVRTDKTDIVPQIHLLDMLRGL